jgi:hypothetical protein
MTFAAWSRFSAEIGRQPPSRVLTSIFCAAFSATTLPFVEDLIRATFDAISRSGTYRCAGLFVGRYERTYLNDLSAISPPRPSIPVLREYIFKIARSDLVTRAETDNTKIRTIEIERASRAG